MNAKLTKAMLRELRSYERDGNPSDPYDWTHAPESLWFVTRDRVIGALLKRGMLEDDPRGGGYVVTEIGHAALAKTRGE